MKHNLNLRKSNFLKKEIFGNTLSFSFLFPSGWIMICYRGDKYKFWDLNRKEISLWMQNISDPIYLLNIYLDKRYSSYLKLWISFVACMNKRDLRKINALRNIDVIQMKTVNLKGIFHSVMVETNIFYYSFSTQTCTYMVFIGYI